jgi:hypothetical protein
MTNPEKKKKKKTQRTLITLVVLVPVERVVTTRAPTTEDATDAAMQEDAGNIMEAIIYISRKLIKKNLRRWRTKRRKIKSNEFCKCTRNATHKEEEISDGKKTHREMERERARGTTRRMRRKQRG